MQLDLPARERISRTPLLAQHDYGGLADDDLLERIARRGPPVHRTDHEKCSARFR